MEYKRVDTLKYVKNGLLKGNLIPIIAKENKKVIALRGKIGEEVTTWSVDEDNNPIVEKVDYVVLDKITNKPSIILTKINDDESVYLDSNGNINKWTIDDNIFNEKYELIHDNIYKTKGKEKVFVQVNEDLILVQNNEEMKLNKGGYINITNPNDMYGVSYRDFNNSYIINNE